MPIHRCKFCDREQLIPEVCNCPFCNKDLRECSEELARKHVRRCSMKLNPYKYTGRRRGRPSRDEMWAAYGITIENDK